MAVRLTALRSTMASAGYGVTPQECDRLAKAATLPVATITLLIGIAGDTLSQASADPVVERQLESALGVGAGALR